MWEPARLWVAAHPAETLSLLAVANVVLRAITKDQICLWLLLVTCMVTPACVSNAPDTSVTFNQDGSASVSFTFKQQKSSGGKNPISSKNPLQ